MEDKFSITNKTKNTLPRISFSKIKNSVLGKNYSLSLVFIGKKKSQYLNKSYRGKNNPTNILSFSLGKNNGEVFITLDLLRKEAKLFNKTFKNFTAFLFIHGLLHLKGYNHGSTMERVENKLLQQFDFN